MKLGADRAINYNTQDFVEATLAATNKKGADVILDMVGGKYFERNVAALAIELCAFLPVRVGAMRRLGAGRIVWFTIPLEWLFLILEPALYFSTILIPPRRWK
ncbi:MAG TPA: zinc-binding dehydrogenase, partial [Flavobacteriales bacterium]|nr:zinc-binding dehydrogenase [Flavobacteriales bacterium]